MNADIKVEISPQLGVCNLCLKEGAVKSMLVEYKHNGITEDYNKMLQKCFNIDMSSLELGDTKRVVCEGCAERLRQAARFKAQVEDALAVLLATHKLHKQPLRVKVEAADDGECEDILETPTDDVEDETEQPLRVKVEVAYDGHFEDIELSAEDEDMKPQIKNETPDPTNNGISLKESKRNQTENSTKRENHVKEHKTSARYACKRCKISLPSFYLKQKHIAETHNEDKRHKCKECPKSYITSGHLSSHVRRDHLKERNHKCDLCDLAFYTKHNLKMHKISHDGVRIHVCNICNKSYQRKSTLKEHMRIHDGDKRFVCAVCGRAFTHKCNLKGHLKVHERESREKRRRGDLKSNG